MDYRHWISAIQAFLLAYSLEKKKPRELKRLPEPAKNEV